LFGKTVNGQKWKGSEKVPKTTKRLFGIPNNSGFCLVWNFPGASYLGKTKLFGIPNKQLAAFRVSGCSLFGFILYRFGGG
jgi:hypothetical protein